jgi:hypothetical protein
MSSFVIIRLDTMLTGARVVMPTWVVSPAEIHVRLTADEPLDVGRQVAVFEDAAGAVHPFVLAADSGDLVAEVQTAGWAPGPAVLRAQMFDLVGNSTWLSVAVDVRPEAVFRLELGTVVAGSAVAGRVAATTVGAGVSDCRLTAAVAGSVLGARVAGTSVAVEVKR